jgi:hypothetical protein
VVLVKASKLLPTGAIDQFWIPTRKSYLNKTFFKEISTLNFTKFNHFKDLVDLRMKAKVNHHS